MRYSADNEKVEAYRVYICDWEDYMYRRCCCVRAAVSGDGWVEKFETRRGLWLNNKNI